MTLDFFVNQAVWRLFRNGSERGDGYLSNHRCRPLQCARFQFADFRFGTKYNSTNDFVVGRSGSGPAALTVQNGGWLDATSSSIGSLAGSMGPPPSAQPCRVVDPGGFTAGNLGTASFSIQNGGLVSAANSTIGNSAVSNSTVTVNGTGSQWSISGALTAGNQGVVNLTIQNGGHLSTATSTMGNLTGSSGTATVSGNLCRVVEFRALTGQPRDQLSRDSKRRTGQCSQQHDRQFERFQRHSCCQRNRLPWSITAPTAGSQGAGSTIDNGGLLSTATSTMGNSAGSNSTATVTGAGSKWSSTSDFTVGNSGSATLSILNQGTVYVGNYLNIGSQGAVSLDGGTLRFGHSNDLTRLNYTSGTIQLPTGTTGSGGEALTLQIFGPSGVIPANKTLALEGGLTIISSNYPLTILNQGAVNVGGTLGLTTDSILNLYGGTLRFNSYLRFLLPPLTSSPAPSRCPAIERWARMSPSRISSAPSVIPTAKGLTVEGSATLVTPLTLNGGTFSVGDIVNSNLLNFQRGTFRMTQANFNIAADGQFGPTLELVSGQHYVVDNTAQLDTDGLLTIPSGASFTAQQIVNDGEITLNGVTAKLAGGTLQNSGLLRGDGRIDSAVTNLSTGEIRVGAAAARVHRRCTREPGTSQCRWWHARLASGRDELRSRQSHRRRGRCLRQHKCSRQRPHQRRRLNHRHALWRCDAKWHRKRRTGLNRRFLRQCDRLW